MSKKPGSNRENFKKTSQKFLEIAKAEFIEHGYTQASTERIVELSGMARGSLYYHYGNKEGIFKAVYKEITDEAAARIEKKLEKYRDDPLEALKVGCRLFFEECKRPDIRVVMLTEGIAQIPYKERLMILESSLLRIMRDLIEGIHNKGLLSDYDPPIILMMIFGMIAECGRSFEYFAQPDMASSLDDRIELYSKNLMIVLDKITLKQS